MFGSFVLTFPSFPSFRGELEIARLLVERGAQHKMSWDGMTPILLGVQEGHLEIVRFFLQNAEIGTEHLEDEELFGALLYKAQMSGFL